MSQHRFSGLCEHEPSAAPLPPPHFISGFQAVPAAPGGIPWGMVSSMLSLYQWAYSQALLNARPRWLRDDWFSQN